MRTPINFLIKIFAAVLAGFISITANAQQTATNSAPTGTGSSNTVAILMGIIALVLAFVIWGMGQVVTTLGRQVLDKNKENAPVLSVIMLLGFSLLSVHSNAQETVIATSPVVNYAGMSSTAFWMLVAVLSIEFIIIAFMMFFIRRIQVELLPEKIRKKEFSLGSWWATIDKKFFTKAIAIEKEADVLLDHDYDGIKELDNALPPWWKYGFAFTVVVAVIYLFNFHVLGSGKNPTEEYAAEMEKAKEDKAVYDAKNADRIDEANLKMPSQAGIDAGKEIFTTVCWACHGKLGEGGAGPNLTDDYWLHKGSLADIYESIKHGYPDKGMQAWEKNYSPKEINNVAGFIKSLNGTHPVNPKAPQGDLFREAATSDSIATLAAAGNTIPADTTIKSVKSQ